MSAPWYVWIYMVLFMMAVLFITNRSNLAAFTRPLDLLIAWVPLIGSVFVFYTSYQAGASPNAYLTTFFGLSICAYVVYVMYDAIMGALGLSDEEDEDEEGEAQPANPALDASGIVIPKTIVEDETEIVEYDLDLYKKPVDPAEHGEAIGKMFQSMLYGSEEDQDASMEKLAELTGDGEDEDEDEGGSWVAVAIVVVFFVPMLYLAGSLVWRTWT